MSGQPANDEHSSTPETIATDDAASRLNERDGETDSEPESSDLITPEAPLGPDADDQATVQDSPDDRH